MISKLTYAAVRIGLSACLMLLMSTAPGCAKDDLSRHDKAVQILCKSGEDKYHAKDYEGAVRDYSSAIKIDPKFGFLYYMRACNKHLLKDYEGALADCNQAISIDHDGNPIVYFQRGIAEYRLRRLDDCISDCNMALKLAPDFPGSYIYRAHAESDKGDKKAALQDCEAYLRAYPTEPQALKFRLRLKSGG